MNGPGVVASVELFGVTFNLTTSILVQWIVMLFLGVMFFTLGKDLKPKPESKRQILAELVYNFFVGSVKESMGPRYRKYVFYIATVFCFSFFSSLSTLFGFRPPTADLSVLATWGCITFVLVQRNRLKTGGIKGYLKSFIEPVAPLLPLNIIGELTNPLSQTFRHFGNIFAGFIIMNIIYWAAGSFALFFPAVLSLYFDIFSATIQAFIFATLTMCYVVVAERDEKLPKTE